MAAVAPTQRDSIPSHLTVEVVEQMMGLPVGSVSPMAWLLLTEEANGTPDTLLAKSLGVPLESLIQLRDVTTNLEGEDSAAVWQRGVIALKTAVAMNASTAARTWDAVESMAVSKLAANLQSMKGNGNATEMLAIANAANKAIRRSRGEAAGVRGPGIGITPGSGGATLELESGHLGTLRLHLHPAIQAQLSNPTRIIDQEAHKVPSRTSNLTMLRLKDTRSLVGEGESTLDKPLQPGETMTFDPTILTGELE